MQKQLGIPPDAHWALVSFTTDAAPDDVIAIASSRNCTGAYNAETRFSGGEGEYFAGGGWLTDATHTTSPRSPTSAHSRYGGGLFLFYPFAVFHDRSPSDHKLSTSTCACRWKFIFGNQSTNSRNRNAQYGCCFVKVYEKRFLFSLRGRRCSKRCVGSQEHRCGTPIVGFLFHLKTHPITGLERPQMFAQFLPNFWKNDRD
jgi:hypothetical protein